MLDDRGENEAAALVRIKIQAPIEDFREVRIFRRGHHHETFEVKRWYGLRRRNIDVEVYDDVIMLVALKSADAFVTKRGRKRMAQRKLRPGCVLIKYFKHIAGADLNALFPNVRVVMSKFDMLVMGLPALLGGIPILIKLASTVTVLFLVAGFYLGISGAVRESELNGALAALSGLVALGGFHGAAMDEIPAPDPALSDGTDRQCLFPQRQQQCGNIRFPDRRRGATGMQGGVSRLLLYSVLTGTTDTTRAGRRNRSLAEADL